MKNTSSNSVMLLLKLKYSTVMLVIFCRYIDVAVKYSDDKQSVEPEFIIILRLIK